MLRALIFFALVTGIVAFQSSVLASVFTGYHNAWFLVPWCVCAAGYSIKSSDDDE